MVVGALNWSGGGILSTGTTDIHGGMTISGNVDLEYGTLDNFGPAVLIGGGIDAGNGAVFNNEAGATFDMQGDFGLDYSAGAYATFNNAGTLLKSAGTGNSYLQANFVNSGTAELKSGLLNFSGGPPAGVMNTGSVIVDSGATFFIYGGQYVQDEGSTILDDGTLWGGDITVLGGSVVGTGTIVGEVVNSGQIIAGGSGTSGVLGVSGNYTQTASGALDLDIGGTTAGSKYDQLVVSGAAMLAGNVDVSLIDGFQPALGETFVPLTFGSSSGNFAFYNGIVVGNRLILDPALNPDNLTLTAQPAVTSTTLAAPASPSVSGQSVTFTAMVTVALPPTTIAPAPTGTVTFYDGGVPLGIGTLSVVSGQAQATFTTNVLTTAIHSISAAYSSGDSNFVPSAASAAVAQLVIPANTSTSLTSSATPSVRGQAVTFTATVSVVSPGSTAVAFPTGTVTFYDDGTPVGTSTLSSAGGHAKATLVIASLTTATHPITAAYTSGDANFNSSGAAQSLSQIVNKAGTTTSAIAAPGAANVGQSVTFTATVGAVSPGAGTPTGSVDFVDANTGADLTPGGVALVSGSASFSTAALASGPHVIRASYSGDGDFTPSSANTGTVTIGQSIIVLDPSAGGVLTLSGNAAINLPGEVFVNSSSSSAITASGNAKLQATQIDVHGHVQRSGNATLSPAPMIAAPVSLDPFASLAQPDTTGLVSYGSAVFGGSASGTIYPGIYSQISVSGNARLILSCGTYIIEGGGLSVSGNASISGTNVTIFNSGSKYPITGGAYGSITLSGNGSYALSPPTSGTYAGIVIFQRVTMLGPSR